MEGAYGSFSICPICGWEDDCVQLANPTSAGGANRESLQDAQHKALTKHPIGVSLAGGYRRSTSWRPLNSTELQYAECNRSIKHWYSQGVYEECDAYWLKPSVEAQPPNTGGPQS